MEQNTNKFGDIIILQEPVYDITTSSTRNRGSFCLTKYDSTYFFHYIPLNDKFGNFPSPIISPPNCGITSECIPNSVLKLSTSTISNFSFNDKDEYVQIMISVKEINGTRAFKVDKSDYFQLFLMLQKLILLGVALPQYINKDNQRSLYFLKRPIGKTMDVGVDIMNFNGAESFNDYWNKLLNVAENLIVYLDKCISLPNPSVYPFGIVVNALLHCITEKIENEDNESCDIKITRDCLFDKDGVLKDKEIFSKIYHNRIDDEMILELIGFIFKIYPLDSKKVERDEIDKKLDSKYQILVQQESFMSPKQIANNSKISRFFKIIDNDVSRTERNTNTFKFMDKPGPILLTKLLHSFVIFNSKLGYLQGMNDLFTPLIKLYIPNWNDEGKPLINNVEMSQGEIDKITPKIFWSFYFMLANIEHDDFLSNVGVSCNKIAEYINSLIEKVSPTLHIWLKNKDLSSLFWMFSSFVMLYKRNFTDIWNFWLKIHCSPDPKNWLIYLSAAIIIYIFPMIPNDNDNNEINIHEIYLKALEGFSINQLDQIGKIAKWIYKNYPIDKSETTFDDLSQNNDFTFFKIKY